MINVFVYFYAGNPDAGGSYLGSATITGGINQGGSKTAVLYGYTITSPAVNTVASCWFSFAFARVPSKPELS